jgi:hypothetical protein
MLTADSLRVDNLLHSHLRFNWCVSVVEFIDPDYRKDLALLSHDGSRVPARNTSGRLPASFDEIPDQPPIVPVVVEIRYAREMNLAP